MYNSMRSGRTHGRTMKTSYPLGGSRCVTRSLTLSIVAAGAVLMTTPNAGAQGFPEVAPACFKTAAVFCTAADCADTAPLGLDIASIMSSGLGPNDGFPEVAVVNSKSTRSVTIFRNTGDWAADPPSNGLVIHATHPTYQGRTPFDVAFGDFDNDNDLDLAVSLGFKQNESDQIVWVLRNDGGGVFTHGYTIENLLSVDLNNIEVADFNGDGTVDIAVASTAPSGRAAVELLWNQGGDVYQSELFESTADFSVGFSIDSGRVQPAPAGTCPLDIVMSMYDADKMLVLINDGAGNFTASTQDAKKSFGIAIGHFHAGQQEADLTLSDWAADRQGVYFGDTAGNFLLDKLYELRGGKKPFGVDVGHLNGDANEDIVVALSLGKPAGHGGIAVFPGYINGTFRTTMDLADFIFDVEPGGTPKPCYVQIADMNHDGFPDVVTSNFRSDSVSVLINCLVATPGP